MSTETETEEWRPLDNFPGYSVSSLGRVSREQYTDRNGYTRASRYLTITKGMDDYSKSSRAYSGYALLRRPGLPIKNVTPGDLVATAFLGFSRDRHALYYRDGNSRNPKLSNIFIAPHGVDPSTVEGRTL